MTVTLEMWSLGVDIYIWFQINVYHTFWTLSVGNEIPKAVLVQIRLYCKVGQFYRISRALRIDNLVILTVLMTSHLSRLEENSLFTSWMLPSKV